jgi:hypothetical protein
VQGVLDTRTVAVLAFADELVARPALLAAFAEAFGAEADATLVVLAGEDSDDVLPDAMRDAGIAVGLGEDELPDLLLLPLGGLDEETAERLAGEAHAVLTEREAPGPLAGLPRFGAAEAAPLRRLGEARLGAAAVAARVNGWPAPSAPADAPPRDLTALVERLASGFGATHLVAVGGAAAHALLSLGGAFRLAGTAPAADLAALRTHEPRHLWLEWEPGRAPLPALPAAVLRHSVLVCDGELDRAADPGALLQAMAEAMREAPLLVLTARAGDDRTPEGLAAVLGAAGLTPAFAGYTAGPGGEKDTLLAIVEREDLRRIDRAPAGFKVTAILSAYNEGDIVEHAILRLVAEGVDVRLVDNWSTDDTVARAQALGLGDRLVIERFPPDGPSDTYDWERLLRNSERIAAEIGEGWVVHQDVDEIRSAPWRGVSMRDALHHVQQRGFNAVDYTALVFHPTDESFRHGDDMGRKLRHFEFGGRGGHFAQIKAWDAGAGPAELAPSGGHAVSFPGRRVFPYKFLLLHYPIRSQEHGERKVFSDRQARWNPDERQKGWHSHYDRFGGGHRFIREEDELLAYDEAFDAHYLVERLTGIGIRRVS